MLSNIFSNIKILLYIVIIKIKIKREKVKQKKEESIIFKKVYILSYCMKINILYLDIQQ